MTLYSERRNKPLFSSTMATFSLAFKTDYKRLSNSSNLKNCKR